MKFSKTALVSSMALGGIILGALAPTTVQAATQATSAGSFDSQGNWQQGPKYGTLSDNFAAYADGKISAKASSDANVTVVSGYLSLEQVPDFSFGRSIAGSTAQLQQGTSGIDDDGNQNGMLKITETRFNDDTAPVNGQSKNGGFQLSAKMDPFTSQDSSAAAVSGFTLNLKNKSLVATTGSTATTLATNDATLKDDGTTSQTILTAKPTDKLSGTYYAQFLKPDDASLVIPADAKGKNGVGLYKGQITWTLTANADGTPTEFDTTGKLPVEPAKK